MLVLVSDSLAMCDTFSVQAPWKRMILAYSDDLSVFFRDGWWLLCTGLLDTDGICICKVPALDTDDIGCVQWFDVAEPFGHGGKVSVDNIGSLGNIQGLVCLSPLDTHGVSGWCRI